MKITNLPIAEATDEQLRDFAKTNLGLDLSEARRPEDVIALIETAWINDWIPAVLLEQDDAGNVQTGQALPEPQQQILAGGGGQNDPKVRLRIGETQLPGGREPFPIGVNGYVVVVQRKLVVDMPYRFYLALRSAVRENVTQDPTTRELIVSEETNYPLLEVIAMPNAAQIAEFHERTDAELMPA